MTYTEGMRATQATRYERYRQLVAEAGVSTRGKWTVHLAELEVEKRNARMAATKRWGVVLNRLPKLSDYHWFWMDQYTPREVHELARGLYGDEQMPAESDGRTGFCERCDSAFVLEGRGAHVKRFCSRHCQQAAWEARTAA